MVGYLQEQVKDFFGQEYKGRKITYVEQEIFNGTAGAVDLVKNLILEDEKFMVIMGDDFYQKSDLEKLLKYDYSVLALYLEDAKEFGLLGSDENNFLTSVIEKPHVEEKGSVNIAAYMLSKEYFNTNMVPISDTEFGLPQTLVKMSKDKNINVKVVRAGK